jgi:hypothetical protein
VHGARASCESPVGSILNRNTCRMPMRRQHLTSANASGWSVTHFTRQGCFADAECLGASALSISLHDMLSSHHLQGLIVERTHLKQRDYQIDLAARLGKTQVVGLNMPLSQQAGYYCSVCDCILRDSQSYLDHINGKWHNRALGMTMRVEKSTVDQVSWDVTGDRRPAAVGYGTTVQSSLGTSRLW